MSQNNLNADVLTLTSFNYSEWLHKSFTKNLKRGTKQYFFLFYSYKYFKLSLLIFVECYKLFRLNVMNQL